MLGEPRGRPGEPRPVVELAIERVGALVYSSSTDGSVTSAMGAASSSARAAPLSPSSSAISLRTTA